MMIRKGFPTRNKADRARLISHAAVEALEQRVLFSAAFRPPAVPLITSDPYLSIWSESNALNGSNTVHWTGNTTLVSGANFPDALVSLIRINGVSYRLMGDDPAGLRAFPQLSVQVLTTESIYTFGNGHVDVTMTFMQPALATDLAALSLPLSYITWSVHSVDGRTHSVQIYDSASSELAVNNTTTEPVTWQTGSTDGMTTLDVGTTAQNYFSSNAVGDPARIDWGYAYLAADTSQTTYGIGYDSSELARFKSHGSLSNTEDNPNVPRVVSKRQPVMAFAFDLGIVGTVPVSRNVIVAYNEVYSIDYFGEALTPYWSQNGAVTVQQMLTTAQNNYNLYTAQCSAFDTELMADMSNEAGGGTAGAEYAQIGALAYRQTFAGMGLAADPNDQPMLFTKENTSNGDIATVDVIFPMLPQLLLFSPTLAKAALMPILEYANSSSWTQSFAPHDLGTYPDALGQGTGGDSNEEMPVETSADMIIMLDAIARDENSPEFANQYWSLITEWANYLVPLAQQSGAQNTTNDFLGDIYDSSNLSVKTIVALGAYAQLCTMRGDTTDAATYNNDAQGDVTYWLSAANGGTATTSGGAQYTQWLFSEQNSGSYQAKVVGVQLYNLAMDTILGTDLFPSSVAASDIDYAESVLAAQAASATGGVPISSVYGNGTTVDYRSSVEWSLWEASMATSSTDFQTLISPIYNYLNGTAERVPESDVHYNNQTLGSDTASSTADARPVIGGVFMKMLTNPTLWSKYSSEDTQTLGTYAPFP